MSTLDELIIISRVARFLDGLSEDRLSTMWAEMLTDGADATERRIFKAAAHAVRARRLVMEPAINRLAA